MALPHAGALTFNPGRVPTSWRALLLEPEWLNDVHFPKPAQQATRHTLEPGSRHLPTFVVLIPVWFCSMPISNPLAIVWSEWKFDHQRTVTAWPEDDGYRLLLPNFARALRLGRGGVVNAPTGRRVGHLAPPRHHRAR